MTAGGGGGASDVRRGSTRLVVAGGAGGAGRWERYFEGGEGGAGGGLTGLAGLSQGGAGGGGGTQVAGGAGGAGGTGGSAGTDGSAGSGGDGGGFSVPSDTTMGGGGGGGWRGTLAGGGGGSSTTNFQPPPFYSPQGGSGGGGSSYTEPGATGVIHTRGAGHAGDGFSAGNGQVVICWCRSGAKGFQKVATTHERNHPRSSAARVDEGEILENPTAARSGRFDGRTTIREMAAVLRAEPACRTRTNSSGWRARLRKEVDRSRSHRRLGRRVSRRH